MNVSDCFPSNKGSHLFGVGQEAEQEMARILSRRGYTVIPVSLYTRNTGAARNAPLLVTEGGYCRRQEPGSPPTKTLGAGVMSRGLA